VSLHVDDEFSLRLALDSELDHVRPRDGLAELVITRYRKSRRRRFASVFGLFVVFAGIGVPIGVAGASGGGSARPGPVALRLGSYTLTLPGQYHLSDAGAGPCATVGAVAAAASSGVCVLMLLTPSGRADPDVPRGAKEVTMGRYRAWFAPRGYAPSGDGTALVIEGEGRDLVVGSEGLSQAGLVSLVSAGLRSAA
jgi:hypothetical protein